jgi:multicomponent Na+:H+ antiporter subunit E
MRYLSLALFLFAFWLTLSGHYTPMLVVAGAASAALYTLAAARMRVADAEGHPIELFWGAVTYFPWLAREIARSAWAVTKLILHPRLPISPTMTVVRASQRTSVGVATYERLVPKMPAHFGCNRRPPPSFAALSCTISRPQQASLKKVGVARMAKSVRTCRIRHSSIG